MRPANFGAECSHGHLARSCQQCDADEEIERLRARVAELENALETAQFDLKIAYEAITNLDAAQAWRPIETAPQHARVLVVDRSGYAEISVYDGRGWLTDRNACAGYEVLDPVAWMPLPKGPEE